MRPKRYSVKVGSQWVSSPTNKLTDAKQFRAVFETREEAIADAKHHKGIVMLEPEDWRQVPSEIVWP